MCMQNRRYVLLSAGTYTLNCTGKVLVAFWVDQLEIHWITFLAN